MAARSRRKSEADGDDYANEVYQSFMLGYVRRINDSTLRVPFKGVRIGNAKYSRLAQINLESGIITFSRYAVENVPERGRRYLVLHELAHVRERGHNKHFWGLVGEHEPDFKRIGRELEQAFHRNVREEMLRSKGKPGNNLILPLIRTEPNSSDLEEPLNFAPQRDRDPGLYYPEDKGIIAVGDEYDYWDELEVGIVCGGSDEAGAVNAGYFDHLGYVLD